MLQETITSGAALERFRAMIAAQGGDPQVVDDYSLMPHAQYQIEFPAAKSGVVTQMAADEVGIASMLLGGGRQQASDQLDYAVGIDVHKKLGDPVQAGESLLTIHSNQADISEVQALLAANITIGEHAQVPPRIYQVIK